MANALTLLANAIAPSRVKSIEGEYRPGPYYIDGPNGGWLSAQAGRFLNWWQMGYSPQSRGCGGAMVDACVSA